MTIDAVTQSWIRNSSDEKAAANGCRMNESRGQHVIDFAARYLRLYEGDCAGEPLIMRDAQIDCTMRIFGWEKFSPRLNRWIRRFTKAGVWWPKKNRKALALDTPIPTPSGWTTMGNLRAGDVVFSENGQPCRVLLAHPVCVDEETYQVTFSNGERITCNGEHFWKTSTLQKTVGTGQRKPGHAFLGNGWTGAIGKAYRPVAVRTTREVVSSLKRPDGAYNHSVSLQEPLELPEAELPIDPYVLGCWLGDGDSDQARITCHQDDRQILEEIALAGVPVGAGGSKKGKAFRHTIGAEQSAVGGRDTCRRGHVKVIKGKYKRCPECIKLQWHGLPMPEQSFVGLRTTLRRVGLLNNKHIPPAYLRASKRQRLALLQGLMDTDGCVDKSGKNLTYCTKLHVLAEGFAELLSSLGVKHRTRVYRPTISGRERAYHWIQFHTFVDNLPVFRLARKLARMRHSSCLQMKARSGTVQITDVRKVDPVSVRCITVDSPTGMFLCGRTMIPTHNSPTLAAWALYLLCADGEMGQKCFLCAKDGSQARDIAGKHAIEMVMSSPELLAECDINKSLMQITHLPTRSILKPLSSGDSTSQKAKEGINGSIFIDETHVVDRAYVNRISRAGISRSEPLQIEVSTAGDDPESYGREQYEYGKRVESGEFEDERFFFCSYEAPQALTDAQLAEDPVRYGKMANPAWGHTVHEEEYLDDYRRSCSSISKLAEFKKYRLNIWQQAISPWLRKHDWTRCKVPFTVDDLLGRECFGGLDLAKTRDMIAWVLIFPFFELGPEVYRIWPYFQLPEETARHNNDKVPFLNWEAAGLLNLTPGDSADYGALKKQIRLDAQRFHLVEFAFDPWNADATTLELEEQDGLVRVLFAQTVMNFAEPTREFERLVIAGKLQHNGHQVLSWQAGHVQVKTDANNNIRPVKPKNEDLRKIDGMVAGIMALARALENAGKSSPSMTMI